MDNRDYVLSGVGKRLKSARLRRGMTQADVAKFVGVDTSTYCGWEIGRRAITLHHLPTVCRYLYTTPDKLFGFVEIVEIVEDRDV